MDLGLKTVVHRASVAQFVFRNPSCLVSISPKIEAKACFAGLPTAKKCCYYEDESNSELSFAALVLMSSKLTGGLSIRRKRKFGPKAIILSTKKPAFFYDPDLPEVTSQNQYSRSFVSGFQLWQLKFRERENIYITDG